MKNYLIMLCLGFLTACGGGGSGGGGGEIHAYNPTPTLVRFDIVDSYGVDTAESNRPLEIDPYIGNGLFDVFWRVNSLDDYRINIRVSSKPSVSNSILIYSEVCGAGRACDQGGGVICEYTSDSYLSCNNARIPTDIISLPEDVYMILEVCDLNSSYCGYKYHPVFMPYP